MLYANEVELFIMQPVPGTGSLEAELYTLPALAWPGLANPPKSP